MKSKTINLTCGAIVAALALPLCAQAQNLNQPAPTDDLAVLREQIAEMQRKAQLEREQSDAQINLLLKRLEKVETDAAQKPPVTAATPTPGAKPAAASEKWYDKINIRGYTQIRYNRLFETNGNLRNEQGDRSIGDNNGFFIRRSRLVFSGQLNKRTSFYIQPDLASSAASNNLNFAQLRDAYFDLGFDDKNEYRIRLGQSKIPYSFENLQSSQNRLPLDRNDALNSAFANERDIGAFFYYAPEKIRKRFAYLTSSGLKGSGDYGVVGLGIFNGQTANRPEQNDGQHFVARVSYPFQIGKQIIEPSLQGYTGRFRIPTDQLSTGVKFRADRNYIDERVAAGFTLYPQPFGLQAEYNVGRGPEFNKANDTIESRNLKGGYVLLSYRRELKDGKQTLTPFVRYQRYNGGKKQERDARSYDVRELEVGAEWQASQAFELTAQYTFARRRSEDFQNQDNNQRGQLLRLQAQFNY